MDMNSTKLSSICSPKRSLLILLSNSSENFDVVVSSFSHAVEDVWKECHKAQLPLIALVQHSLARQLSTRARYAESHNITITRFYMQGS